MQSSLIILVLLVSSTLQASAQSASDCEAGAGETKLMAAVRKSASDSPASTCPNPKKIKNMCLFVSERSIDREPVGRFRYLYKRKILEAACVDIGKDDEQVVAQKVQKAWKTFENELICNSVRFDIINGSIIKFAVSQNFYDFLMDVAEWKVDMNKVDANDGGTVLDYIQTKINTVPSSDLKLRLKGYYDLLRKAGAKHRAEL
jgi:hypothetical protein